MPDHKTHEAITRALTGKTYSWVHDILDAGTQVLGPQHRRVTHTQDVVLAIFLESGGDVGALLAAEAHILADEEVTRSKQMLNRALGLNKLYNRKRRR